MKHGASASTANPNYHNAGGCYLARVSHANLLSSMSYPVLEGGRGHWVQSGGGLEKDSGL